MNAKQFLIEFEGEACEEFFQAGGTIHLVRVGGQGAVHTATREEFRSVKHALFMAAGQLGGKYLATIDRDDPHEANPCRKLEVKS